MCKEACSALRSAFQELVTKIDFATLDACSEELEPLRHALHMARNLAQAFLGLLVEETGGMYDGNHQNVYDGLSALGQSSEMDEETNSSHRLRLKTCLVFLRACCDKIPNEITPKAAMRAAPLITQGIVEQLLSWTSEAEMVFDALKCHVKKHASAHSRMYSYSTKPTPLEPRRSDRIDEPRPVDRRPAGRQPAAGPCARIKISLRKLEGLLAPSATRLQRLRPPRLVIPEGSN